MLVVLAATGGCANQAEIDRLNSMYRGCAERSAELERNLTEARALNDQYLRQANAAEAAIEEYKRKYGDAQGQLDSALANLRDFEGRIAGLQLSPLDPETDRALAELAAKYPDLIQYDAARGMLRFSSDLTFDSGSAVVRESAKASLSALSDILKGTAAGLYEVVVVGHTDSQRISSNTAQRHPTNMHLSAHRAIAVRDVIVGMGVAPERFQVAGYGEFRPAVPNSSNGNTPQNRRVEIFLTRARSGGASSPSGGAIEPDRAAPPTRRNEITK